MLQYPEIQSIAFKIGPFAVHWYGLMYLIGFVLAWLLAVWRTKSHRADWSIEQISDLLFYVALGVILGGRIGYVIFYNLPYYWQHPLEAVEIWHGGMSFHGGLIGVLISLYWASRRLKKSIWDLTDFIAPLIPIGLAAGRIGNFINQELWGRVTTVPWGMVFPQAGLLPRHPSQLYEFALEGVVLFIILWWFSAKPRPKFAVSALFLLGYGSMRFFAEFFRQPDPQYGFIAFGWLTMGQLLCMPMIVTGLLGLICVYRCSKTKIGSGSCTHI